MKLPICKGWYLLCMFIVLFVFDTTFAQTNNQNKDTLYFSNQFIHRIGIDRSLDAVMPTNPFLQIDDGIWRPIRKAFATHLKYSFQRYPNTQYDRIYGGAYQGIGFASYTFNQRNQLGSPIAVYLFQGARIARLTPRLSFNYEWNFGLSFKWKPYDEESNPENKIMGSKKNAYMNVNFYLNWALSNNLALTSGVNFTHFSNGNTRFPNLGVNTVGWRMGLLYSFNKKAHSLAPIPDPYIAKLPKMSYDLILFGSWRSKSVLFEDVQIPSSKIYTVLGFSLNPMRSIGYKIRTGISLDGVYDGSANVYTEDHITGVARDFYTPELTRQLVLGLSGRVEYVMPYFTLGLGLGVNAIHHGGDLKGFYQILALKIALTPHSFVHIGYNLRNFNTPNFLMLGLGYRFY